MSYTTRWVLVTRFYVHVYMHVFTLFTSYIITFSQYQPTSQAADRPAGKKIT